MRHLLALESSCDETAAAICREDGVVLCSEISSQIAIHQPYGGVVPELASRNHLILLRPLIERLMLNSGMKLAQMDAFAATGGPGLASSLLICHTAAKAFALACGKPFFSINHLEGHLLSPFIGHPGGVQPCVALIVSGGHTSLIHLRGIGDYILIGKTRDDAAGEAFDKVGKMLGLPYPAGPEIDKLAKLGSTTAFDFPRGLVGEDSFEFSFSGLKTSVLYLIPKIQASYPTEFPLNDVCASFQEAVVDVLVDKTIAAARKCGEKMIAVSGGVSCNSRLCTLLRERCERESLELLLAPPLLCTDNAAMIGFAAIQRLLAGHNSPLTEEIDPNLPLV